MKLIIDIPETMIDWLKNGYPNEEDMDKLLDLVLNGTPLPKGHGRLIDADAFQKTYCKENCGDRSCVDAMDICIFIGELLLAPTIIEADKEITDEANH